MLPRLKTIALIGIGVLCMPAFGANQARPGAVNYVEGAAFLEGKQLTDQDVGSTDLNAGEVLSTKTGKVEILLTPGVFLRIDDNSAVRMISPDITLTQVELLRGRAGVEVDELYKENDLQVIDGGIATQLVKNGYYEFDAAHPTAMVFQGKAAVEVSDGKYKVVKSHHEFALVAGTDGESLAKEKPADFNARKAEDDLYKWNSLRSQYLAEDNNQMAGEYADASNFDPGWYWDPYGWDYTFIGGGPFMSPFGFGFYPAGWGGLYGGGFYGGGYGYGGYGYGGYNRYGGYGRYGGNGYGNHGGVGVHGTPIHGGGFHGGAMHSGGFHGGGGMGGGFHGGGGFGGGGMGGGGFHGGGGHR